MIAIKILLSLLVGCSAFATETQIPFVVKRKTLRTIDQAGANAISMMKDPSTGKTMAVVQEESTVNIPSGEISRIVRNVKNEICGTIENGEFKLWLKGEASGKILGVGASSESGIEVTVKCEAKGKQN